MGNEVLEISGRFNGPLDSGNGGYSAGVIAGFLGGVAEVSLRAPVPLDTRLEVEREDDDSLRLLDGETLVAEACAVSGPEVDLPEPVSVEQAREAAGRYRGLADGVFSRCFVCGRAREDSFGVFAGAVEGRDLVASPWTPPAWTADGAGNVRSEFVWAVLDCPTYFAAYMGEDLTMSVLGRMTARVEAPVAVGEEHVVVAWPIASEGRKRHAGAAVMSAGGKPLAVARALMIELRSQ